MDMAFARTEVPCLECALREVQNGEQTQELRLADGMPDIGKVLCAWGQVILRGKEWRSDSILVTGGMMMWVLYMPEDGSSPRVLDGWLPFQMRWSLPEGTPEGKIRVQALTRFADARSVSARKLMLRGGIGLLAEVWVTKEAELSEPKNIPAGVELLKRRYPVRLPKEAGEKTFSLEEELNPGIRPEKLIYYTLRPEITEQKVVANKIAFRGNANLHAVWAGEDGQMISQDFPLPFSQFAELDGSFSGDARVDVSCGVTDLELETDENGLLQLKCSVVSQYLVDDQLTLETVADAYLPGGKVSMERQDLSLPVILEKRTESVSAEANIPVNAAQIADISFLPDFPRQYREGESIQLEIPGTIQLLVYENDGALRASSCRWEGKSAFTVGSEAALSSVPLPPPVPQFSLNGDIVNLRAELPVQLLTAGGEGIPMVTELEAIDAEPNPQRPSLILRRAGTDGLWHIAKSCGSTVEAIRSANNLSDDPKPGQMLLIPVL